MLLWISDSCKNKVLSASVPSDAQSNEEVCGDNKDLITIVNFSIASGQCIPRDYRSSWNMVKKPT